MKQKKTFLTLLLIIAILCLGIAYAVITGIPLTISGTASATASDENFEVKFTHAQEGEDKKIASQTIEAEITAQITDEDTATISCSGLTTKGDYLTAVYTIENASPELTAYLTAETVCDNDAFIVTTDWEEASIPATEGTDTKTITVKIELKETVAADTSANVTVNLTAGSVQPTP